MLSNALALAIATTAGAYMIYSKLPRKVRRFVQKYALMTDLTTLVAVYLLLGGTLTALMAGALCGLFVSMLLHIANNEEDFLYLYDLRDFLKTQLAAAKQTLNEYGKQYRQRKGILDGHLSEVPAA